jgi:hypothetical protein
MVRQKKVVGVWTFICIFSFKTPKTISTTHPYLAANNDDVRGCLLMSVAGRVYFCKKFKMWNFLKSDVFGISTPPLKLYIGKGQLQGLTTDHRHGGNDSRVLDWIGASDWHADELTEHV